MPCNDISEKIAIKLDGKSRLTEYALSKKTCGGAVGLESLIIDKVRGISSQELIHTDETAIFKNLEFDSEIERFLHLKHFFAIKSALKVFHGITPGNIGESCTVAGIDYFDDKTVIDADINIDLIVEQIKSCEGCHCGS